MEFKNHTSLYKLKEIAAILRAEGGCAWDRAQTSKTLKPYLIEEAYEVYEAIESGNPDDLKEELGDLLYQVYAHSQIADEEGKFSIDDVADGIAAKLVYRHPHVFGDEKAETSEEVIDRWEKIKKKEKAHRESILDGVPVHLPALLKAYRVQQKVSRIGFDWDRIEDVEAKLEEEISEFRESLGTEDHQHITEELGDMLFTLVNIARFLDINPEEALLKTVDKFMGRFRYVEKRTGEEKKDMDAMTLEELDALWDEAKKISE